MKKELKNRGLNVGVILAALFVLGGIVYSFFEVGNAFHEAPALNKVAGISLGIFTIFYAFKSSDWLDFIESDKVLMWAQIATTFIFGLLSLLILAVWH